MQTKSSTNDVSSAKKECRREREGGGESERNPVIMIELGLIQFQMRVRGSGVSF